MCNLWKKFLSFETNPGVLAQFFEHLYIEKKSLLKKGKKKRFSPKNWAYFMCFADPKLFSNKIWVLAWQNGHLLPIFTENLKVFGLVVVELQRFIICHFDLKTVYLNKKGLPRFIFISINLKKRIFKLIELSNYSLWDIIICSFYSVVFRFARKKRVSTLCKQVYEVKGIWKWDETSVRI